MSVLDPLSFNLYLRKLRTDRGWSLRDVERLTEGRISNPYLAQLEGGKFENPSLTKLHQLSAVYAVDFNDLCHRALNGCEPLPPVPCCPTCGRPYA